MGKKVHELKTVHPYFLDVWTGKKPFEVRLNDRDYQIGDVLYLREYFEEDDVKGFGDKLIIAPITYILNDAKFCKDGYVVLGIPKIERFVMKKLQQEVQDERV